VEKVEGRGGGRGEWDKRENRPCLLFLAIAILFFIVLF
jgi:hypothetical protein